jgi:hypothetical protein
MKLYLKLDIKGREHLARLVYDDKEALRLDMQVGVKKAKIVEDVVELKCNCKVIEEYNLDEFVKEIKNDVWLEYLYEDQGFDDIKEIEINNDMYKGRVLYNSRLDKFYLFSNNDNSDTSTNECSYICDINDSDTVNRIKSSVFNY